MKTTKFIILGLLALLVGCSQAQERKYTPEEMALRKDIGELLIVGFRGTDINDTCHIVRDIKEYGIGGVILFEYDVPGRMRPRNISSRQQLKRLCTKLQKLSDETLFISIDQEGGYVSRLKEQYGFPRFASAQRTAAEGDDSVRYFARLTAKTLKDLGINLDFAPCVDVNTNPDCPVIGKIERSFSADPQRVAQCAAIWIDELQSNNVIGCLKHFPGHGSSKDDTHLGLADVSDTWQPLELEPYRRLIANGNIQMIMTTHVFNNQLDSVFPATLSAEILTNLLRDSLHFEGIIITDDLAMGAMVQQYNYEEILRRTILAGADLLCLSNNGQKYNPDIVPLTVDLIFGMVERGEISADRIRQSAERIRQMKETLNAN